MKLVDNKTGKEICHGDIRTTFSGTEVKVLSFNKGIYNEGLVRCEILKDKTRIEYFPFVIDARMELEEHD